MSGAKRVNTTKLKKTGKNGKILKYNKYSEDLMKLAVDAVENNQISLREAERMFGIPRATIYYRLRKRALLLEGEEVNTDGEIRCQTTLSEDELRYQCAACKELFQFNSQMKRHIRRHHYNRVGRVPLAETQEIDQVWYERVANTDAIVKMIKVSENVLIIHKVNEIDLIDLPTEVMSEEQAEVLDVRDIYPVSSKNNRHFIECYVCHKSFGKRLLSKHFEMVHAHLVKTKCDACQMKFKRVYNCARHVCPESIHKIIKKTENDEWTVLG